MHEDAGATIQGSYNALRTLGFEPQPRNYGDEVSDSTTADTAGSMTQW